MSPEPQPSTRALRWLLVAACLVLGGVWTFAAVRALRPPWRGIQEGFRIQGAGSSALPLGIQQQVGCTGERDRCTTCHLGIENPDLGGLAVPRPYRAHSVSLAAHPPSEIGCTACHGGVGRALDAAVAHSRPGSTERDPRMASPHLQASCAACHVPGDGPGMEHLVRGATEFLELGCGMCHPLGGGGRGGWDFGPDLRTIGRRSLAYLKSSVTEPAANFAESTMPSFAHTFEADAEALADLLLYLQSLVLPRPGSCNLRRRSDPLVTRACQECHAGAGGAAVGRFTHRCLYLLERGDALACRSCHTAIPDSAKDCPLVNSHRGNCGVCHDGPSGETP